MKINTLSLQDFARSASNTRNENARIKLTSDGVKSTALHTFNSTSQKAMSAFLSALKNDLGPAIADMATAHMHSKFGTDTPLTVRMVRETVDEAVRISQSIVNTRDKFISGIDKENNFAKSFNNFANEHAKEFKKFTEKTYDSFMGSVKECLVGKYTHGHNTIVNLNGSYLADDIEKDNGICSAMLALCKDKPERCTNKNIIAMSSSGITLDCVSDLLKIMPEIEKTSPDRTITMNDVWQHLFNEPLPEHTGDDKAALAAKIKDGVKREIYLQNTTSKGFEANFKDAIEHTALKKAYSHMTDDIKMAFKEGVKASFRSSFIPSERLLSQAMQPQGGAMGINEMAQAVSAFCTNIDRFGSDPYVNSNILSICSSGIPCYNSAALMELMPEIADNSAHKSVTMNDVWKKVFKEDLPVGDNIDKQKLGEKLDRALEALFDKKAPASALSVTVLCNIAPLERAVQIARSGVVNFADIKDPDLMLKPDFSYRHNAYNDLVRSFIEQSTDSATGKNQHKETLPVLNIGGKENTLADTKHYSYDISFTDSLGRNVDTTANIKEDSINFMLDDLYRYVSNNSSDTPSADQINTIYDLLGNRSCQRVIEGPFSSHNSSNVFLASNNYNLQSSKYMSVSKGDNDSFKVEIKSHDDIDVTAYNGKFKIGYEIFKDGSFKVTDFSIAPKFGQRASELAAMLSDSKISDKDLTSDLTKAHKRGQISDHEHYEISKAIASR